MNVTYVDANTPVPQQTGQDCMVWALQAIYALSVLAGTGIAVKDAMAMFENATKPREGGTRTRTVHQDMIREWRETVGLEICMKVAGARTTLDDAATGTGVGSGWRPARLLTIDMPSGWIDDLWPVSAKPSGRMVRTSNRPKKAKVKH